jgi:hypothetical protein
MKIKKLYRIRLIIWPLIGFSLVWGELNPQPVYSEVIPKDTPSFPQKGPQSEPSIKPLKYSSMSSSGVTPIQPSIPAGRVSPQKFEEPARKKVIAEGLATIYAGDVAQARLVALRSCYAEAVGRVCGREIGSLSLVRNAKQVSDVVMSRSRGFVSNYKVLKEGLSEKSPNTYEVIIEAEVVSQGQARGDEREGLRLYLEILGNPRLMIILNEQKMTTKSMPSSSASNDETESRNYSADRKINIIGLDKKSSKSKPIKETPNVSSTEGTALRSAEAALAQAFSAYGYQVVTSDDLLAQGLCDPEVLRQAKAGITSQALKVAQAAGVDIALLGVMRLSEKKVVANDVTLEMVSAEASAKALIVSNGHLVHAFHHLDRASATDQLMAYANCLDRTAKGIADVLAWKIPQILTEQGKVITLHVHDVDYDAAARIQRILKNKLDIEEVRFDKLPDKTHNEAKFTLMTGFTGINPHIIIEFCQEALKEKVNVIRIDKSVIEISIKNRDKKSSL